MPESPVYHQSWYAVARTDEVPPGALVGKDFLGTRIMLWRDGAGALRVQSAFCPHLGADLSLGELVDGCVRCPYHHWSYDSDGV
ncbi:MAG: Rieske 2Fe-2S domain-containing protein, partial [Vulcanimicrobiaceae bacterium]